MEHSRGVLKESFDVLVVGAGPTGLACAIEAQRAGLRTVLVDKGCLCNSLFHYPSNMTFFTTPELLEIGDMPFSSPNQKPSRNEALESGAIVPPSLDRIGRMGDGGPALSLRGLDGRSLAARE